MSLLVALPFHAGDAQLMLKNLRWQSELCGVKPHTAVLCIDGLVSPRVSDPIAQMATRCFAKVLRFKYAPAPISGWPQGPNWAFQQTAIHMQQYGQPWLWLEPDAVPTKPDWLEQLEAEYKRGGRPFMGYVVPDFGHCNGVAVYPSNTPTLIPSAMRTVDTAWDCAMREEMISHCHHAGKLIGHMWGEMPDGKIHHRDGIPPTFPTQKSLDRIPPTAVLVHRDKYGTVIDRMRERFALLREIPLTFCGSESFGPKVEIFIVSYAKDFEYLEWNIKSIRKFALGFSGITLLVPTHDEPLFKMLASHYDVTLLHYDVPADPEKWHLAHQLEKTRADVWCPHADFICFTDSDCIFTEPVSPADYIVDGKPVLVVEEYSRLQNVPWQATVEKALGMPVKYLSMCRHPAIHFPEVLRETRRRIAAMHGKTFSEYVLSGKATFPWHYSEFSTIGTIAMTPKWKDKYHIIDLATQPRPKDKLTQFWSHSPPDVEQPLPSVGGSATPREIMERVLA